MRTKFPILSLKLVACSLLSLNAGQLPAQTGASAQPARPIVQKDYDELRREAGRIKPEEVPVLQQRAEAGDLRSQLMLGMLHQLGCGVVKPDASLELAWYRKAADQGSSIAENQIGTYFDLREGHDQAEGLKW
jgi:TPR repeat protein